MDYRSFQKFLVFTAPRSKGKGQKTFLQGNCARQRHSESWRLCCVPLCWPPKPSICRTNRELLGVLDLQHGGKSQMVLSPWRNQNGQEASRWQGEPWQSLTFYCSDIDIALWWLTHAMLQLNPILLVLARPVPVMPRGWEWRPDNLSQVPGGEQGGVWMFDSQSEAKQYPPRPLLPGWNIWPYHWSADHIWRSVHPGVSHHDGSTEKTPFERELKSLRPKLAKP